jgi:flagellar biosynthesis/type III secretory pathway M-ring protein FliF/YscJ
LYNNVLLGLLIVAGAIAIAVTAVLVLSSRKGAALMNAKDRELALALEEKDVQIERIKQEKDEQIEQIKSEALVEAEKSAALASRRAAEMEKEYLELKQQLANRRITKSQHKVLVDILSKKTGRIIIETMGDPESGLFAEDILKTFIDSGWALQGRLLPQGVVWTGLILYKSPDPDAATVMQALESAGIPFSVGSETRANATIMVGGKPPLF